MRDWETDAIEADVESEEAARNERRGPAYDPPESIGAIAAKRRACEPLTEREAEIWRRYTALAPPVTVEGA